MKRLLLIAILGGAALVPLAAQAQRGMGVRGGGVASPGRVSSGFVSRPSGFMPARSGFTPRPMPVRSGFVPRPMPVGRFPRSGFSQPLTPARMRSPVAGRLSGSRGFRPQGRSRNAFSRFHHNGRFFCNGFGDCDADDFFNDFDADDFFRNGAFFNNCFNTFGTAFGCSPFFTGGFGFGGFGLPLLVDPFFAGEFQQPQPQQPVVVENEGGNREMAFEVQALRDEIQAMRDEERARNEARNAPASKGPAQQEGPNAVLVFHDGRQLSVRNYAIADHTIWVLSANSARKIPISDLDVTATEQTNANNGVEFHLPH